MAERVYRGDGSVSSSHVKADKSDDDIAGAQATERLTDTSRLGSKGKGGAGMPKQSDYGSTAEWSRAMSDWRAGQSKTPQKQAVAEMLRKK